jgi:hypothetical protein
MLQVGGKTNLGEEALGPDDRTQLRVQYFECNTAIVLQVAGEVDRRHPTGPDFPLDDVAVG